MLIVYCETCSHRISEEELQSGTAQKCDENKYLCAKCAPAAAGKATVAKGASGKQTIPPAAVPAQATSGNTNSTSASRHLARTSHSHLPMEGAAHGVSGRGSRTAQSTAASTQLMVGSALGIGVLLAVIFAMFAGSGKAAKPAPVTQAPTKQERPAPATRTPVAPGPVEVVRPVQPAEKAPPDPAPKRIPDRMPDRIPDRLPDRKIEPTPPSGPGQADTDPRAGFAQRQLDAARDFCKQNPDDPWTYKDKLAAIVASCGATPAGKEAADLVAGLKLPERPAPATPVMPEGGGEWTPVFDGKTLDCLLRRGGAAWRLANGAIELVPNVDDAAQSSREFGDGEIRFQFEVNGTENVFFAVRQGNGQSCKVRFEGDRCHALAGKPHVLIFTCQNTQVTAKLDDQPVTVASNGAAPATGLLQFNANPRGLRILALEYRPLPKTPTTPVVKPP